MTPNEMLQTSKKRREEMAKQHKASTRRTAGVLLALILACGYTFGYCVQQISDAVSAPDAPTLISVSDEGVELFGFEVVEYKEAK